MSPDANAVFRLRLSDFRNYRHAALDLDGRPVVLTGPNGAGKTNLLEAVSLLAPGRGIRKARPAELDRVEVTNAGTGNEVGETISHRWAVAATITGPSGEVDIGTGRDAQSDRRVVRIDGQDVRSQAALGEYFSTVWLTPQMDRVFQDSAGERRRFLDRLIYGFDPAHAGRVNAYEKALRQRSRLLKDGVADDAWLSGLEAQMIERGIAIAAARLEMSGRLARACARGEGPFPGAGIGLSGDVEGWLRDLPAVEAEDRFHAALVSNRRQDGESGGAAVGPHRSDMVVTHLAKGLPAGQCSTGEQKALLIAIVLAHARLQAAERGTVPVLLLDELAAHLDEERRTALFDTILGLGAQAWITGTDPGIFDMLGDRVQRIAVADAAVAKVA